MRNKILLLIMLLFTAFGLAFSGLKVVEVEAATEDTISYDLEAINIPSRAISSFPVTYKSVYGNKITWTVEEGQDVITYDGEAHWMVVNRSETTSHSIEVTVTVGEGNTAKSKTQEVSVPAGKTATPKFTITYDNDGNITTETYSFGQATFELEEPASKAGYHFVGWYENDVKVTKILVGSARNYNLTAKWEQDAIPVLPEHVSLNKDTQVYDGNPFVPVVTVSTEGITSNDYTVSYTDEDGTPVDEMVNAGKYKVVIKTTEESLYDGTVEIEVEITKATYEMDVHFEDASHVYDGQAHSLEVTGSLPAGLTVSYSDNNTLTNVGSVTVTATFTNNNPNYNDVDPLTATLEVTAKDYIIAPTNEEIFEGGVLKSWTLEELKEIATGVVGEDDPQLSGNVMISYYLNGNPVATPLPSGAYTAEITGLSLANSNYNLVIKSYQVVVKNTDFTISTDKTSGVYNGNIHTVDVTVEYDGNQLDSSKYSVSYLLEQESVDEIRNAGTYTIVVTGLEEFDGMTLGTKAYVVEKAVYDMEGVSFANGSFEYDGQPHSLAFSGDLPEGVEVSYSENNSLTNVGSVTVTAKFTGNPNYEAITDMQATLTVTQKVVVINGQNVTYTYGDIYNLTYTVQDDRLSEEEIALLNLEAVEEDGKVVVTHEQNNNYSINVNPGTITMNKREVTVTANSLTSVYGSELEALTATAAAEDYEISESDLAELLALVNLSKAEGTDAGEYAITASYKDAVSTKFEVTFVPGTYTITALDITDSAVIELLGDDYNVQSNPNPAINVKHNGEVLNPDLYGVAYEIEELNGTITVTLKEGGNYTGTPTHTYTLTQNGKAEVVATELQSTYATILTGELTEIDALPLGDEAYTITWSADTTAVKVAADGKVSVVRLETGNTPVVLTAFVEYGDTSSAKAVFTFEIKKIEYVELTDENTGVKIDGLQSEVTSITAKLASDEDKEKYGLAVDVKDDSKLIDKGLSLISSYDITLNNEAQPYGNVKVYLPIPEGYTAEDTFYVYYIDSENIAHEITCDVEDEYVVFETDHFSVYTIWAEEKVQEMLFKDGDQVVIATIRSSGNYFLLSNDLGTASTDRYQAVDTGLTDLTTLARPTVDKIWTVKIIGNNYYLQDESGKRMACNSDKSATLTDEGHALSIIKNEDGTYSIYMVDNSERCLQLNSQSSYNYFAFYTSNQIKNLTIINVKTLKELTDAEKLAADAEKLNVPETVNANFSLPVIGSVYKSTITWSCENEAVVFDGEGNATVTRGAEDVTVEIIATLTINGEREEVVFEVVVEKVEESQGGVEEKSWKLLTDASTLQAGEQIVIVASGYDFALSTTQNSNNRGQASVTKDEGTDTVTFGNDVQILTIEAGNVANTYAFNTGAGYLYAASSSKNYLRTESSLSDNSSWSITIADGVATIVAQGSNTRSTMQYNQSSSIFACYSSASQKAISIYVYR